MSTSHINFTIYLITTSRESFNHSPGSLSTQLPFTLHPQNKTYRWWLSILFIFPILAMFGNGLVVTSVLREKILRSATNYFIVSLAVADIALAILVMPMSIWLEITNGVWTFGALLCDAFIMLDVMFCTASILNLTAISIDRFVAVTQPLKYAMNRNFTRIYVTIAATWIISFLIALPIACGMNHTENRPSDIHDCTFTNGIFIICSSIGSFYLPAVVMTMLYYQIFLAIRRRACVRGKMMRSCQHTNMTVGNSTNHQSPCPRRQSQPNDIPEKPPGYLSKGKSSSTFSSSSKCSNNEAMPTTMTECNGQCNVNRHSQPTTFLTHYGVDGIITTTIPIAELKYTCSMRLPLYTLLYRDNKHTTQRYPELANDSHSSTNKIKTDTPTSCSKTKNHTVNILLLQQQAFQECGFHNMKDFRRHLKRRLKTAEKEYCEVSGMNPLLLHWKKVPHVDTANGKYGLSDEIKCVHQESQVPIDKLVEANARRKINANRERKATKTLAIVLGAFLLCWLPYFTVNVAYGLCLAVPSWYGTAGHRILGEVYGAVTWLGYINSFLNPIIYTTFNEEFRRAFRKILFHR